MNAQRHGWLYWQISDAAVLTGRALRHIPRNPQLLVFSTIQPVMFVVLFRYVLGGAIKLPPGVSYVNFLMAGVFVNTVAFGSFTTGVGLAEDLQKGLIDRFRSLPMSRGAVLAGRTLSDIVTNGISITVMLVVGVIIGFGFESPFLHVVAGILHDQLRPDVHRRQREPALVDFLHVDRVVHVHELEQVEQEKRHVGVRARGDVRHRGDPGYPGVELAQVHRAGVGIDEHVDL